MKIVYKDIPAVIPRLAEINYGQVFRPTNSQVVYMRLPYTAGAEIFTSYDPTLNEYIEPIQVQDDLDDKEADEFISCVNLRDGLVVFLHRDTKVESLKCELVIKEEE